jgi:acetyl-CoA acetyltransferase
VQAPQADGPNQFTHPYGLAHNVLVFAMPFSRYLARYGRRREEMAPFIVQNRSYVIDDPTSVFAGQPLTEEDYLAAPIVGPPLSLLDCDMPVTGCGAFVVCSAERARDLRQRPAYVTARASLGLPVGNAAIIRYEDLADSGRHLAANLWGGSGLRPADVQQANLYDGFSYYTPMWAEWLGFCGEGEGIDFVSADAKTRVPLNTMGGALGRGRLHGTPQLIEAVHQLQGRARHQVPGARVTLAQAGDPSHGSAAVVLTSE